jgi:hypothetical protein
MKAGKKGAINGAYQGIQKGINWGIADALQQGERTNRREVQIRKSRHKTGIL